MSRPSSSPPNIPRLIKQLNSADASTVSQAIGRAAQAAALSDPTALRLAQGGAVPALARALQSADEAVAGNAGAVLISVARAAPDLVAGAAGALVAALGRVDSVLAVKASAVFMFMAEHNPSSVAAEPGALQALASALRSATDRTVSRAASALLTCAGASPGLARAVAATPGALAGLCEAAASGRDPRVVDAAVCALINLTNIGDIDLAPRIVSTPGVIAALARTLLGADASKARGAAGVLSHVAKAGPEHARAVATPAALAALASAAGREGLTRDCIFVLATIIGASPQLAQHVANAPGAGAALLAALTGSDELARTNAAVSLSRIADVDAERFAQLVSDAPAALPALSAMLQSNNSFAVEGSLFVLAKLARHDVTLVAGLPDLPGAPLQALAAVIGGANVQWAATAASLLCEVMAEGCAEQAQRVLGAPGVEEAVVAAISSPNQRVVANALGIVGAAERSHEGYVARFARAPGKLQVLLRALNSPEDNAVNNAAYILCLACQTDAELAQRAAAEPGVLRALAARLSRGECGAALAAVETLARMAVGDGRCPRPDVLCRLAAEEGVLPALAAAAQSGGLVARESARVITAISTLPEEQIARMLCGVEGVVPTLVSVVRTSTDALTVRLAAYALKHIAATSPQDLGRRVLDAGAAEAAVEAMAREPDQAISCLLQALLAVDAAKVAAVLAAALPPPATVTTISARAVLASASLSLGPVAVEALAHAAEAAATLRARVAALEALASAAAAEADATRPHACAACGLQRESTGAGRLWPCAGCSGKGPAGRVLYCDADCQRAHWPAHKAYCKRAAAAAAAQSAPGGAA
ncbi:hypothetical protein Rsub_04539 [Raphidocelis subcapitata]|uniref:MYND-type domain-containing protein n=1 Tax=Raphidocelis subcapitata TaxID=307507 RepID=A0A2V0P5S8_9CHLO|nr:hypothetical protein Rsub_04539 [Raphidocelis subcapitata]|eukprot:GBF92435.1 hypothetical protein Rsub_04539 [Raphidocelis subcapitata]